jgi:hypothetical protein
VRRSALRIRTATWFVALAALAGGCQLLLGELDPSTGDVDGGSGTDGAIGTDAGAPSDAETDDGDAASTLCDTWSATFDDGVILGRQRTTNGTMSVVDDGGATGSGALAVTAFGLPSATSAYVEVGVGADDGGFETWGPNGMPWSRVASVTVNAVVRLRNTAKGSTTTLLSIRGGDTDTGSDFSIIADMSDGGKRTFRARVRPDVSAAPWQNSSDFKSPATPWFDVGLRLGRSADGGADDCSFSIGRTSSIVTGDVATFSRANNDPDASAMVRFGIEYASGGDGTNVVDVDVVSVEVCRMP